MLTLHPAADRSRSGQRLPLIVRRGRDRVAYRTLVSVLHTGLALGIAAGALLAGSAKSGATEPPLSAPEPTFGNRLQVDDELGCSVHLRTFERVQQIGSDRDEDGRPGTLGIASREAQESYRWLGDGYRLERRRVDFQPQADSRSSPEYVVLHYYDALLARDFATAFGLLSGELRAAQPFDSFVEGFNETADLHLEEIRVTGPVFSSQPESEVAHVYVRAVVTQAGQPQGGRSTSMAGVWRLSPEGDGWRLAESSLEPTLPLATLSAVLPAGARLRATAQGDVRGTGRTEDVAVVFDFLTGEHWDIQGRRICGAGTAVALVYGEGASLQVDQLLNFPYDSVDVHIGDVNSDRRAEVVIRGRARLEFFTLFSWVDGRLLPLFKRVTFPDQVHLVDLEADGILEIRVDESGYCGSAANATSRAFVFRWEKDAYHPATADFPGCAR